MTLPLAGRWCGLDEFENDASIAGAGAIALTNILDAIELPILVVRRGGMIACFNQAAGNVLGLLPTHIGRKAHAIEPLDRVPRLDEYCALAATDGEESRIDVQLEDSWFVIRVSPCARTDGQVTGAALTFENVTAFRASIAQAIYERESAKAILNTFGDPLIVLDTRLRIQAGNRAFHAMFGRSRSETQGMVLSELAGGGFAKESLRQQLEELLGGGHEFPPVELDQIVTDRGPRALLLDAHPLTLPGHPERRVLVTFQDITERKLAQAARDQRSEEDLARARAELARVTRVTSLGAMTASIAHEVNQPLAGIVTNASTCLRMLDADPPNIDGARDTATRTIRDAQRASDVITRLRGLFARKPFAAEPMDLNEAISEVMALSLSELERGRVTVRTEFAGDLPLVIADRVQLQQVFLNLVLNASEAMSGIDDRPRELTVLTERHEDGIRVSVRDTGTGFAPDAADRLFEPFYSTKSGGMGIGLAVSRTIIEHHRGRLWAVPHEDGATVSFSLPTDTKV